MKPNGSSSPAKTLWKIAACSPSGRNSTQKTTLAQELESKNTALKEDIELEKLKLKEIEKTTSALLDTIEIQKNTKEMGRQKLIAQIDELRAQHDQEKTALERKIATLQDE